MRYLDLAAAVLTTSCAFASPLRSDPPNVVLIIADDQGFADMSCTGLAKDVKTPNLDRLASRGVRFTHSYATSPICNASRAGLITGVYQERFGTFWYGGKGIHDASFPTIAEVLKARGYVNGYVGKFHYGGHVHKPGNRNFPLEHGFDELYGFAGGRKHYLVHNAAAEAAFRKSQRGHGRKGQSLQMGPMWDDNKLVDQDGFTTELFSRRARRFLRRHKDERVFLVLGMNAVHNFTHQLPPEYLKQHGLTGYHDWDPATEKYYDWYQKGRKPNNPEGRAHYLGQLYYLDREVGRVLDTLDELSLTENTIVIYISDNGGSTPIYANNGPLRGSKYTLYEGGIRVPLIVSWPGHFQKGKVRDNVVSSLDLFPTICAATGAKPPKRLDGFDLSPLLTGDDLSLTNDSLVWDTNVETAVRQGRWKLKTAKSKRHANYEMVELEIGTFLYDLSKDPGETTDVAAANPELVKRLLEVHAKWRAALNQ